MLIVKNLEKNFGKTKVLKNINLEINEKERVVIIGPSGCGKSTLLRCINQIEKPTKGKVLFEGIPLDDKKTDINKIRIKMGMVFQQFNLFPHLKVIDNIILAKADRLSARGQAVSEEMVQNNINGLNKLLNFYLEKKDTLKPLPKLLDGNEIMDILKINQSPVLGEIITSLKEAQLNGDITTTSEAVVFVRSMYDNLQHNLSGKTR